MQSIGKMRHRLELQKATNTTDAGGGMTQSYNTINNNNDHNTHN